MKIYGEYLFIENLIVGLAVIYITSIICKVKIGKAKFALGGIMCGLFSFTIVFQGNYFQTLLRTMCFSSLLVLFCFGKKGFSKKLLIFWLSSLFFGGTATATLFASGSYGITTGGILYIEKITYAKVMLGFISAYTIFRIFANFIFEKVLENKLTRIVQISICEKNFNLLGYIDTGNSLKEPITGASAIVITQKEMNKIINIVGEEELIKRYCAIPYNSAGLTNGILNGFRIDSLELDGKLYQENVVIAVYEGEFKSCNGSNALLGREFVEGGII